jgi:putative transposase
MRNVVFANGEYYHIFNRGVERRTIFTNAREYSRACRSLGFYRFRNLPLKYSKFIVQPVDKQLLLLNQFAKPENRQVSLIAYCFMPNHFHLLVQQLQENGITEFISKFSNSHTKYFNTKHERVGPLLQGVFKAVHVENETQLLHLNRYIHLNPASAFIVQESELDKYPWSSFREYIDESVKGLCDKDVILNNFPSSQAYKQFVLDQAAYAKELKLIEHLCLE